MPRTSTARAATITTASDLFRRQGYAATGLEQVLAVSGAPKGSFYHYFPDGKEQLAAQSLAAGGERVRQRLEQAAAVSASPGALVTAIAAAEAKDLRDSDYQLGCPVATVALELAATSSTIAKTADAVFTQWAVPIADRLVSAGRPAEQARRLARWTVANLEGALILARAARDASIVTDAAAITAAVLDDGTEPR